VGATETVLTAKCNRTVAKLANSLSTSRKTYNQHTVTLSSITPPNTVFDIACTDTCLKISTVPDDALLRAFKSKLTLRTAKPN
jgi:hypothetical protein